MSIKLVDIIVKHTGKYMSYYQIDYVTDSGRLKTYEMVSKIGSKISDIEKLTEDTLAIPSKAVIVHAYNEDHSKILINKEFRLGINKFIYNQVAGFIEPGETLEQAANRELQEETGLNITKIIDILPPSFTNAPVCDDNVPLVICTAAGTIVNSTNEIEITEPFWATKQEVKELLHSDIPFSGRLQTFAYMWVNSL